MMSKITLRESSVAVQLNRQTEVTLPPRPKKDDLGFTTNRDLSDQNITILGICTGHGTAAEISVDAPNALRQGTKHEPGIINFLNELGFASVSDSGDVTEDLSFLDGTGTDTDKLAAMTGDISQRAVDKVLKILNDGELALTLGGDHSMAFGSLNAFALFCHQNNFTGGVIHIDAHADINSLYAENNYQPKKGESGNLHGMPIAGAIGPVHPAVDQLIPMEAKLDPKNILSIGLNGLDKAEVERIRIEKLQAYPDASLTANGLSNSLAAIEDLRSNVDVIFVSFDLDAVNKAFASGTEMQNDFGLSLKQLHRIGQEIGKQGPTLAPMLGLDVAEYAKSMDDSKNTTINTIKHFIGACFGINNISYVEHMDREISDAENLSLHNETTIIDRKTALIEEVAARQVFRKWYARKNKPRTNAFMRYGATAAIAATAASVITGFFSRGPSKDEIAQAFANQKSVATSTESEEKSHVDLGLEKHKAYTGVERKDLTNVGFTTSVFTGEWYIRANAPEQSYEQLRDLLVNTMSNYADDYKKVVAMRDSGLFLALGVSNDSERYFMNSTISNILSSVSVGLGRVSDQERSKLINDSIEMVFSDEKVRDELLSDLARFTLDVENEAELADHLKTVGLL